MTNCPRCGYTLDQDDYVMTEIEQEVIKALRDLRKSPLSTVPAQVIADCLGYSQKYISEVLSGMKARGLVCLPFGHRCSGWLEGDVMRELSDIIRGCSHFS